MAELEIKVSLNPIPDKNFKRLMKEKDYHLERIKKELMEKDTSYSSKLLKIGGKRLKTLFTCNPSGHNHFTEIFKKNKLRQQALSMTEASIDSQLFQKIIKDKESKRIYIVGSSRCMDKLAALELIKNINDNMKSFIVDSVTLPKLDIQELIKAFQEVGKIGFKASEAATALRGSFKNLKTIDKNINQDVAYGKRQAKHWAQTYSHKIQRKLL